jgi:uncharacterized lipoprotein YmbA
VRSKALKYCLLLAHVTFLSACSNNPTIDTSYYLLDAPKVTERESTSATPIIANKQNKNLEVASLEIKVAEYLDQPYLIIQTDQYQVNFAQSHMWAEPLVQAITRTLKLDLNKVSKKMAFIKHNPSKPSANSLLEVNIDYFHPTHLGKVILTGDYIWRSAPPNLSIIKSNSFHIEKKLQIDGYHHSVKQMRALIKELAKQINQQ